MAKPVKFKASKPAKPKSTDFNFGANNVKSKGKRRGGAGGGS